MNTPMPQTVPTMESAIEEIVGRRLTDDERQMLIRLRDRYGYDDGDPLVVVLAMMGAHKVIVEEVPQKIIDAATKATELHLATLREQSMLVAKSVVKNATDLVGGGSVTRLKYTLYGAAGGAGLVILGLLLGRVLKFF